jgi:phosphatidylserine decarboxylase
MKHKGKATAAAFKMILWTFVAVAVVWAVGAFIVASAAVIATVALALTPFLFVFWVLFAFFTLYFFRDPTPRVPAGINLVVSPAHAKVDAIEMVTEPEFMQGECQRISMFLSVLDVHVQNAPVSGKLSFMKYTTGQFLNALKAESAQYNENVLLGFDPAEPKGKRVAVRLIAGVLARRIIPYIKEGDEVVRGDRISLIQFGSRADVYLPLSARIQVKLGDKLVGGESVLASFE